MSSYMVCGLPGLTEEEMAVHRQRDRIHDAKIQAALEHVHELRKTIKPSRNLEKRLPSVVRIWCRERYNTPEQLEDLYEAETDHRWAIYDKSRSKRPLYPRKRAISPSNQDFNPRKQQFDENQSQSLFFQILPPELRGEVYRATFGGYLIVEITAAHGGFDGPPPSREHRVFFGSRVHKLSGEVFIRGACYSQKRDAVTWHPTIVPFLLTCRKLYAEAIPILYGEMLFKCDGGYNDSDWSKYLLRPRLDMIRTAHIRLQMGYPWEAQNFQNVLDAAAKLKALQKLCILGNSGHMIDCDSDRILIDEELWAEKKHIFMPAFQRFEFIKDVDILMPMRKELLVQDQEQLASNVRLHGLTEDEVQEKKDVWCACKYMPERMQISRRD